MKKVSKKNFIMATVLFAEEAKKFVHEFASWTKAGEEKARFCEGELITFAMAEVESPEKELHKKYVGCTHAACRALFALDRKFYCQEHLHIVGRLEDLSDMEAALEEIENFLSA